MQPKPNEVKIELLPFVKIDDKWSVPDVSIFGLYKKMHDDGTFNDVFYDGGINNPQAFIDLLKDPGNLPVFILVDGYVRAIAWINALADIHATAHFCVFKEAWGKYSIAMGIKALEYWFSFTRDDGSPRFELILGVTPSHYRSALKFIENIGFIRVGEVPKILFDGHAKRRMPAVFSYCERFSP